MSIKLFATLLLSLSFVACAKSNRGLVVSAGPTAPINEPDTRVIEPGNNGGQTPGGPSGSSSSTLPSGNGAPAGNGGGTSPGGLGGGSSGSGPGASQGGGGTSGGGGGTAGGSPVPEPGTLLLFGTGLAGFAGFSLRRRRRED